MTSIYPVKTGDLGGKLVIKVQLGDDLRRILIHNEELTLDELVLMLQRVFKPQLDNLESFIIKYKDEDDEYITIAEEFDLSYAIHTYKILRLRIILPHACESSVESIKPGAPVNSSTDASAIISQINRLQDDVKQLVEKFDEFFLNYKVESKPCPHESAKLTSTIEASSNTLSDNEPPKMNSFTPRSLDSAVSASVPHKPVESAPSSHPISSSNQPSTLDSFMPSSLSGSLSGQHSMPPMSSAASAQPPILPSATSLISNSLAPQNPPVSSPQPQQPALLPTSYLPQQSGGPSSIIGQGPPPRFVGGPMPPPQQQYGGMAQPPLTHQPRPVSAASNASSHQLMGGQVQGPPPPPMPPSIPMMSQPSQLSMGGISSSNMMTPPPAMSMSGMNSGSMISPPPPMGAGVNRFTPAAPSAGSGMIPPPPPMGGMGPRAPPQPQMPLQLGGPPMYGGAYDQRPM